MKIKTIGEPYVVVINGKNRKYINCICPLCSKAFKAREDSIKSNRTKYCMSCKAIAKNTKHSDSKSKLYSVWNGMKQRCYNQNHIAYKYYGGIGVSVCDEWRYSYESFKMWCTRNGYRDGLTIDKDELCEKKNIHPKIYSPETCMLKNMKEQAEYKKDRYAYNLDMKYIYRNNRGGKMNVTIKKVNIGSFDNVSDAQKARDEYILRMENV